MIALENKTVSLLGFGISNRALCDYLMSRGIYPVVRCKEKCSLPKGIKGIFTEDYLDTGEDIVFRSPAIRPDRIRGNGRIYTELSLALDSTSAFKIGVTGSDGKTTTSTLIHKMLCRGGENAILGGNIGKALVAYTSDLRPNDFVVAEMSSFQLMDYEPCLDVAVITCISPNHLDWHRDMDEYICAKHSITKNAKRLVLNYDDDTVRAMGNGRDGVTYFSLNDCTHLISCEDNFVHVVNGVIFYNSTPLFSADRVRLRGRFNLQNILSAIGVAYRHVDLEAIVSVAESFTGVEGRMEHIDTIEGVSFFDSAIDSTPSRTKGTLSAFPPERVICIMGGYDKNLKYDLLRDTAKELKLIILCGENRHKIEKACHGARIINVNTLSEAVALAKKMARAGDFVILSPASASFDMFKNYKEKSEKFKEAIRGLKNG
ncbi:MAG: UDP-N-acetylmuramoyl-L-alanine--D-glutamate ligase [Clostridia bacterium]|nr:UDP-N-acetylmuramoyl-L-alanine--D-glutamate ligase [Clostridia bacterium]